MVVKGEDMKIEIKYVPSTFVDAVFEEDINGVICLSGWAEVGYV